MLPLIISRCLWRAHNCDYQHCSPVTLTSVQLARTTTTLPERPRPPPNTSSHVAHGNQLEMPSPSRRLFIQMSGAPGSGKSSIAKLLGTALNAVVIDHDILRSPILDAAIPFQQAAKCAYDIQWTMAQNLVQQGLSVIIDSPCNFQESQDRGMAIAKQQGYKY